MTTTDPHRLDEALGDTLRAWPALTGQAPPMAIFCAEPHPFDDSTLCRRLDGHSGIHASDPDCDWANDPKENDR